MGRVKGQNRMSTTTTKDVLMNAGLPGNTGKRALTQAGGNVNQCSHCGKHHGGYSKKIVSYVFSSTKLENKKAEQVLSGSKRGGRVGGREVIQTMYTHMNKCKIK
jgi:hypothetical protein